MIDKILVKCAKNHMNEFDINKFKETHPSLYKTIMCAINKFYNIENSRQSIIIQKQKEEIEGLKYDVESYKESIENLKKLTNKNQ